MNTTHLIQIEDEALFACADEHEHDVSPDTLYVILGKKIYGLCSAAKDPERMHEYVYADLGCHMTAISWRGLSGSDDDLYYWGGSLIPLWRASDQQIDWAIKRLEGEKTFRRSKN